jgi:hypothetical protein
MRVQIWNLRTHKVIECLFLSSSTRGIHRIVTRRMRKLDHRPFFQGFPEQKACIMADYNETFKRHTMLVFHFWILEQRTHLRIQVQKRRGTIAPSLYTFSESSNHGEVLLDFGRHTMLWFELWFRREWRTQNVYKCRSTLNYCGFVVLFLWEKKIDTIRRIRTFRTHQNFTEFFLILDERK